MGHTSGSFKGRLLRAPSVLAWLRLARVFQKVDRASVAHLRAWGLSVAQFDVLAQVGSAEGMTQQELAQSLLVTKGNVTQLLDRMETSGWIRRCQEGRCNRLVLTDEGRRLYASVVPAQEDLITRLFATLPPEERAALLATLRRLDHTLP
jgi:DNA-binding MarR family transcriptional regulator